MTTLSTPLDLASGQSLPNRIGKSAMTEGLADEMNRATDRHARAYKRWAEGGLGLNVTGNVIIDRRWLERPGNVVVDNNGGETELAAYAAAGKTGGVPLWMQINHPGRQCPALVNPNPVGPSDVMLGSNPDNYGKPRPLTGEEIQDVIHRFGHVAETAKKAGFDGVQVHSAHGYLCSSFLNPRVNTRTDEWGGPLENRARLLLALVRVLREAVGPDLAVSVKLNSSDFQAGGFTLEDCQQVVAWLAEAGLDLLEISGGSYEQPAMMGAKADADAYVDPVKESTKAREAYFVEYAKAVRPAAGNMPLMVTGGFRSRAAMEHVVQEGLVDVVGLGRPLCVDPDAPKKLLAGEIDMAKGPEHIILPREGELPEDMPPEKAAAAVFNGQMGFCYQAIRAMGDDRPIPLDISPLTAAKLHGQAEVETEKRRVKAA